MTPHSLLELHKYLGTEFDGSYMTRINDDIIVGLFLDQFCVYSNHEWVGNYPPDKVVSVLKNMMRK